MEPIRYYNRDTAAFETEQVYGENFLRWAYGHPMGAIALNAFVKRPLFSAWYGRRMSRPGSKARVAPFIDDYGLQASEFADPADSYGSFNEFFYRKLKPESRLVDPDESSVVFPADGRHLGFNRASEIDGVFVKGQQFDLPALLGDAALARRFADMDWMIATPDVTAQFVDGNLSFHPGQPKPDLPEVENPKILHNSARANFPVTSEMSSVSASSNSLGKERSEASSWPSTPPLAMAKSLGGTGGGWGQCELGWLGGAMIGRFPVSIRSISPESSEMLNIFYVTLL